MLTAGGVCMVQSYKDFPKINTIWKTQSKLRKKSFIVAEQACHHIRPGLILQNAHSCLFLLQFFKERYDLFPGILPGQFKPHLFLLSLHQRFHAIWFQVWSCSATVRSLRYHAPLLFIITVPKAIYKVHIWSPDRQACDLFQYVLTISDFVSPFSVWNMIICDLFSSICWLCMLLFYTF